jgi:hypothetical protein
MFAIQTFNFSFSGCGPRLIHVITGAAMSPVARDPFTAELEAYNRAFSELELPWRWDARTFHELVDAAADRDFIGTYVERNQAHLLRVYEKAFLRDLILAAKERCLHDVHDTAA